MFSDEDTLEKERSQLYEELSKVGDFRRGSLFASYRRCGKSNCACAQPDHPGHGPQYRLTTSLDGKTQAKNIHSGPELEKVQEEVANYQKFKELSQKVIEVNERICDVKEATIQAGTEVAAKKGASKTASKRKSPTNSAPS
jgi:hypothetical protein